MKKFLRTIFKQIIENIYLSMEDNLVFYDEELNCYSKYYYIKYIQKKYRDKTVNITLVDLDFLKETNDKFGHSVGTKHLLNVVNELKRCSKIVIRYGGDEFILIDADLKRLDNIAYISYGTCYKSRQDTFVSVIKKADFEMYKMKKEHHDNRKKIKYVI